MSAELLSAGTGPFAPEGRTEVALTHCLTPERKEGLAGLEHSSRCGQPHCTAAYLCLGGHADSHLHLLGQHRALAQVLGPASGRGWARIPGQIWMVNPHPPQTVEEGGIGVNTCPTVSLAGGRVGDISVASSGNSKGSWWLENSGQHRGLVPSCVDIHRCQLSEPPTHRGRSAGQQ